MFYQDTDSNYNLVDMHVLSGYRLQLQLHGQCHIVRKWKERGLYGDELGQFKNDTCKGADGVGVLGYFLERKTVLCTEHDQSERVLQLQHEKVKVLYVMLFVKN